MDRVERNEEDGSARNWNEAFHLFANVIACDNDDKKIKAIIKLAKHSRHAPESILALTIPILVELLGSQRVSSPLVIEASVYCLKCIALQAEGRLAALIGQSDAIPIFMRLLANADQGLERAVLKCLRNLVTFCDENRMIVANNGGVVVILRMLNVGRNDLKLILLEILSALALIREVRKSIWNSRSVHRLIEAARCGSLISRTRAAQAIGLLGLVKNARPKLVEEGAIQVLMNLMEEGETSTKLVAGNAIGVISSHVDFIRPIVEAGVIPLFVELLKDSHPIGQEIAEDVFCVLAVSEENTVIIVDYLVRILRGEDIEAKAAAADVIWDFSSYKHTSRVLQNSGAIPLLVELLKDENFDIKDRVSGAVAQLSYDDSIRAVLADCGAIPILISMWEDESEELKDNAAEALVNFSTDVSLGRDQICSILEVSSFEDMKNRVMQIRASEEYVNRSLRQIGMEELASNPSLS